MASTQTQRMRAAIDQVVAVAPGFLRGDIDADQMATTMLRVVGGYAEQDRAAGDESGRPDAEARALHHMLAELRVCGSGYLAGRCDAACVARTITGMLTEFGTR